MKKKILKKTFLYCFFELFLLFLLYIKKKTMGQTKKLYEQMTLQQLIMERYYDGVGDEDYQYEEYLQRQNEKQQQEMEYYFNNLNETRYEN